ATFLDAAELSTRETLVQMQVSEATTRTIHGNFGGKTAPATPQIHGEHWFFNAEMLFWRASEGGTDYAQRFDHFPGTTSSNHVHNRKLSFPWDFGFRAGMGKIFHHNQWDLFLNFTRFLTKNTSTASAHSDQLLTPLMLPFPFIA